MSDTSINSPSASLVALATRHLVGGHLEDAHSAVGYRPPREVHAGYEKLRIAA
ncbi:hypothetical protein QFZ82_006641 [Streptomyces sp. V4I23]|uniref:hypothetical protein n=1 Tax=Streptomyces sp. V4I23 TaxID=3042282 RepID=UPI0027859376|nr:hypothetical protein [Streptomyces sp. V4I23]MDQ1012156.1 hypothetical protein [Streptomyces sp. V4I23]